MDSATQERTFNRMMLLIGVLGILTCVSSCSSAVVEAVVKVKLAEIQKGNK
jgi:hypothetical protein